MSSGGDGVCKWMSHDAGPRGMDGTRVPHHNNSNAFHQQDQADILHGTGYFSTPEKALTMSWTLGRTTYFILI